jgi:hypothetical protein
VDPERVDLGRYPRFEHARWWNTTLTAGDCLYIPALNLHYVRSVGRRNAAAMTMWSSKVRGGGAELYGAIPRRLVAHGLPLRRRIIGQM